MASAKNLGALGTFLDEVGFVVSSIRSRGLKHYLRALGIGAAFIMGAHKLVFVTSAGSLEKVRNELDAASATAQHADTYRELDENIKAFSARLPPVKDSSTWFLNTVLDSLRAEGLVALTLSPVAVNDVSNFKLHTITLSFKAKFNQAASWVARVEGSKKLMHISKISIQKDYEKIGINDVQVVITSLVPRGGN